MQPIPPASSQVLSADIYTPGYRIVGKLAVSGSGLIGLLNSSVNPFLEVLDARLARLHMPSKLVDHYQSVRVVKSQIFAVTLARREDLGMQPQARGGYVHLNETAVRFTSPVFEMQGTLEWVGSFDFSKIMVEGNHDFVPIYNTSLTAILIPAIKSECPAALFNRRQVDLMALDDQRIED